MLPLGFLAWAWHHHASLGLAGEMLWLCHVAAGGLGVGLLLGSAALIRPAALWTVAGILPWACDAWTVSGPPHPSGWGVHLGSALVGVLALRRIGAGETTWRPALAAYLAMQVVARFATEPRLNVNLAHAPWPGWQGVLPGGYPGYWALTTLLTGLVLWLLGRFLTRTFPPPGGP